MQIALKPLQLSVARAIHTLNWFLVFFYWKPNRDRWPLIRIDKSLYSIYGILERSFLQHFDKTIEYLLTDKKKSFAFPLIQIDFLFGHSFNDNDTSLEESRNRKQTKESPLYDSNGDGDAVRASQCLNNSFFNHCAFLCLLSLSPSLARSASLHKLIFSTVLSSERFVFSVCSHLATNMQWSITTNISRPIIDRLRNQAFTKSIEL